MRLVLSSLLSLIIFTGCSSEAEINCNSGNIDKLLKMGEEFIYSQTRSDRRSENISFEKLSVKDGSCSANLRQEKVSYSIKGTAHDGGKVKPVSFSCQYGKLRSSKTMKTICQMN